MSKDLLERDINLELGSELKDRPPTSKTALLAPSLSTDLDDIGIPLPEESVVQPDEEANVPSEDLSTTQSAEPQGLEKYEKSSMDTGLRVELQNILKRKVTFSSEINNKIAELKEALQEKGTRFKGIFYELSKLLFEFFKTTRRVKRKQKRFYALINWQATISGFAEIDIDNPSEFEELISDPGAKINLEETRTFTFREMFKNILTCYPRHDLKKAFFYTKLNIQLIRRSFRNRGPSIVSPYNPINLTICGVSFAGCLISDISFNLYIDFLMFVPINTVQKLFGHIYARRINKKREMLRKPVIRQYVKALKESGEEEDGEKMEALLSENPEQLTTFVFLKKHGFPIPHLSKKEEVIEDEKPTVILSGISEDSLSLAREIDRQGGTNVILTNVERYTRKANKAIIREAFVYKDGELHLVKEKFKVRPSYVYGASLDDEEKINKGNVPNVSMPHIDDYTCNKEVVAAILRKNSIRMPASKCWKNKLLDPFLDPLHKEGFVKFEELHLEGLLAFPTSTIDSQLIKLQKESGCNEIVIKPSDAEQGKCVKFFEPNHLGFGKAASFALSLIKGNYNVTAEERIQSAPVSIDGKKKDWNLRVFVSRDENNNLKAGEKVVRIDDDGKPVNISITADTMPFERICEVLELSDEEARKLEREIDEIAVASCIAIENTIKERHKIGEDQQQDWWGIDVIVKRESDGSLKPYVIEVNDHHSGGMWDLDNVVSEEECGRASRDFAATIIRRATMCHQK